MFSWIEYEILDMSRTDYLVLYGIMVAALGFLLYYSYQAFRRFRFINGTATSRIRSAAQGHVELKGLGEWLPNDTIVSPFSQSRCVWYHCTIDKRKRSGKRSTWTNISDECSGHLFRLIDETGECIVDPDHAHVIPELDRTWYGYSPDYRNQPARPNSLLAFGFGNYRFRERLIRPATQLYALGWFRTVSNNPAAEFVAVQVEDLVRQWKMQPQRYLRDFDFDQNGKIQQGEWQAIRASARRQVLSSLNQQQQEHHLMSRPADKRQPFILSTRTEEDLVARKKLKAYVSVTAAFMVFSALVILSSLRAQLPL
ncbi:MAG: E3 ubiquitin ligase family protein [Gammaproteobacteria bacterium]|nr:E3 ubiquitin ligase family protein [Gammaproteobacteria bacterium]MDH3535703.1 E3 ubiquitin ligase family protein [Gammaproteobacteria bacterium]